MSSNKRPLEDDSAFSAAKRVKSNPNGDSNAPATAALLSKARADILAKLAKINALKPVTEAPSSSSSAATSSLPSKPLNIPGVDPDLARKVAEAKKLVAQRVASKDLSSNPYLAGAQQGKRRVAIAEPAPAAVPQGAGLKMAAHPLLLDTAPIPVGQSKKDKYKPMLPKFSSIKANARMAPPPPPVAPVPVESKSNPYASGATGIDSGFEGAPKERSGRQLKFNQKGKYMALGQQMRREAQLEELKQKIAENARKAGLGEEFEVLEKSVRREAPPNVEWWDVPLLQTKSYDDVETGLTAVRIPKSPITIYVQHPIPIPAPWLKNEVQPRSLMLTKKEQKKLRKQRRQAEQQDKQDRIRMGLMPPEPPKVRLANLMKVLTSAAVQDPTKVEARVRREVTMRRHTHEKMNEERKLTDEQRREKIETKKVEEERKGLHGAVFKVKTLTDPAHRFKVRKNAEQMGLTGICIFHPSFSLVFVEGSAKSVKYYKRLMLARIKWTEAAQARADVEIDYGDGEDGAGPSAEKKPEGEKKEVVEASDLTDNRCDLCWEGPLRDRSFNNFRPKACPSDGLAREALGEKLKGYWDLCKTWVPEEDVTAFV